MISTVIQKKTSLQLGDTATLDTTSPQDTSVWKWVAALGSAAGTVTGAYHGYKRNRGSIGWAIGWALLGGLFWPITIPVEIAQGFGRPA